MWVTTPRKNISLFSNILGIFQKTSLASDPYQMIAKMIMQWMIKFSTAEIWRPVLVKIMTIKFRQLQQILWTCCVFLLSLNKTFFSVLAIIFSNKCYFCFNYTNNFFIHPWIICGPCIWSGLVRVFHFLRRPFWKLCKWRSAFKENAKPKHCEGKKRKRFSSCLQNLSRASGPSLVMRFSGPEI